MSSDSHITTRRAFIAATGFGGVSLYGLWAAYGAAPGPLALLGIDSARGAADGHGEDAGHGPDGDSTAGGHGGHGAATAGPSADEFGRMTAEFIERYRLPDGVVHPRALATQPDHGSDAHAGHGADPGTAAHDHATAAADGSPVDVLMTAGKWYYLPAALRLDAGQPYRFRMMTLDVSHGASIQFGRGGRMVRLRPGRLTEIGMTFERPGRYLVMCTLYCGAAHDFMQATIDVV
ncbi:MAG: hypothetical protein EHM83_08355 [Burkholderiales bacterium]|nr:MAG: hypothetical protein EHM83_08355 [Burkholderiales bacterium]